MTPLTNAKPPISLRLSKDLTRAIKRGHAWLYSDAIETKPSESGATAIVCDRQGQPIACGMYDPSHPIPLRVCRTEPPWELDDDWLQARLRQALALRTNAFASDRTTGFRLVAGEGDGLPGLIVDIYDKTAVLKFDGGAPEAFYNASGIADWLRDALDLQCVVMRSRMRGVVGQALHGRPPSDPVQFLENGMKFTADVLRGQKTGFFLDQRDNRALIQSLSANRSMLNLFSFNGGFSVAAGCGGARDVTSVDVASPAIAAADVHWKLNGLEQAHQGVVQDCFEFLEQSIAEKRSWDLVVCDPPSFAPSEKARQRAVLAYQRLAQLSARVTKRGGLLALASCSSHIDQAAFTQANLDGLGRARRKARLLCERGLPVDHPTPLAMPELRYLKFQLLQIEKSP